MHFMLVFHAGAGRATFHHDGARPGCLWSNYSPDPIGARCLPQLPFSGRPPPAAFYFSISDFQYFSFLPFALFIILHSAFVIFS